MKRSPGSIFEFSPSAKIQLVEDLWEDLASDPNDVPVQEWHKNELSRRKPNLKKFPASILNWEEMTRRVRDGV